MRVPIEIIEEMIKRLSAEEVAQLLQIVRRVAD